MPRESAKGQKQVLTHQPTPTLEPGLLPAPGPRGTQRLLGSRPRGSAGCLPSGGGLMVRPLPGLHLPVVAPAAWAFRSQLSSVMNVACFPEKSQPWNLSWNRSWAGHAGPATENQDPTLESGELGTSSLAPTLPVLDLRVTSSPSGACLPSDSIPQRGKLRFGARERVS